MNLLYEQTVRSAVECTGIGLHSGAQVSLRILPAAAGTGIVFRRVDLDDYQVEATGRNVAKVSYATSLMKKGVLISTTEHLLSAFMGAGVDNAIVELNNLELPILDGSAQPFIRMIQNAGIRQQTFQWMERNGFSYIPSESNCFMVDTKRPGQEVRDAMAKENVLIGRVWPIMPTHVRVTVGTQEEMERFQAAFLKVMRA